jgi:hypothetical protein
MTIEHSTEALPKFPRLTVPDGIQPFLMITFGWLAQIVYSISSSPGNLSVSIRIFMLLWFTSASAFFFGSIAGMIFGIPRSAGRSDARGRSQSPSKAEENLEQIYDWLTKIIIGLILVNARQFLSFLGAIGDSIGMAIAPTAAPIDIVIVGGKIMGIGSIIYGFACGFLRLSFWSSGAARYEEPPRYIAPERPAPRTSKSR